MIKSEITKSTFSDTAIETIKEGIISNTVQMSSVSNNLNTSTKRIENLATLTERMKNLMQSQITTSTERMENLMKSQIANTDKLEKLMQSQLDLQEDNKSFREELTVIREQPKISQSENVQQPPASAHEEGH